MTKARFSHLDRDGAPRMVDVGKKVPSQRMAKAEALVDLGPEVCRMLAETSGVAKGNVVETARVAGIMAAKRTADLIPMCHPLTLDHVSLSFDLGQRALTISSEVRCQGRTGVEMEALTAVSVAALTVYDMCKSASKGISVEYLRLVEKSGGKSGGWHRSEA